MDLSISALYLCNRIFVKQTVAGGTNALPAGFSALQIGNNVAFASSWRRLLPSSCFNANQQRSSLKEAADGFMNQPLSSVRNRTARTENGHSKGRMKPYKQDKGHVFCNVNRWSSGTSIAIIPADEFRTLICMVIRAFFFISHDEH